MEFALMRLMTVFLSLCDFTAGSSSAISCIPSEIRGVQREVWRDLSGLSDLKSLLKNSRYPDNVTQVQTLTTFKAPQNDGDKYGQRLLGYFVPSIAGSYRRVPKYIYMEMGVAYLIQVVHVEVVGQDYMELRMISPTTNSYRVIPTDHLIAVSTGTPVRTVSMLGDWGQWSSCIVTCGEGRSSRHRACADNPAKFSLSVGALNETANKTRACRVNISCVDTPAAPHNVTANSISSTAVKISWSHVRHASHYIVTLSASDSYRDVVCNASTISVEVRGLKRFTFYSACVAAVNSLGRNSACVNVSTDEGGYNASLHLRAVNYTSQTAIRLRWAVSSPSWIATHIEVKLIYEVVNTKRLNKSGRMEEKVEWNATSWLLEGLTPHTTYSIQLVAMEFKEQRLLSNVVIAETCPCPVTFTPNWFEVPPYALDMSGGSAVTSQPIGVVSQALSHMVKDVCGVCLSYGVPTIAYGNSTTNSTKKNNIYQVLQDAAHCDLSFPVTKPARPIPGLVYIPMVRVPGVLLLTVQKSPGAYARTVARSVCQCWPLLVINLVMTSLAAIVLWMLKSYGDRVPRSLLGRTFAMAWSLMGMVLTSLLISAVTSSLIITVITENMTVEKGRKVGAVEGSVAFTVAKKLAGTMATVASYPNAETLAYALSRDEIDGCLIDMHSAGFYSDQLTRKGLKVSQVINRPFTYGVLIGGNASQLANQMEKTLKVNELQVLRYLQKMHHGTDAEHEKNRTPSPRKEQLSIEFLDPRSDLYTLVVLLTGSLLACAVIGGMMYHVMCYKNRKTTRIATERAQRMAEYHRRISMMREILEEFYRNFRRTYDDLKELHGLQLKECLRKKTKNDSQVELQHIRRKTVDC
ncbi:predicted protein [Nematostella vectensis]|uniref:Fibronectin type-III domain-containing protein n=1 Tax=Nematostella vectensis TaxID=45351 RepID=A7SKF2_NEMVE|nr:predicted protein [Nematostella vectensis]|eukprot:XP_001627890.1 predicted protein [Nematostella vectensis]